MHTKFALLIHPGRWGAYRCDRICRYGLRERFYDWYSQITSPRKISAVYGLSSPYGCAGGFVLSINLTSEQINRLPASYVVKKIFKAGKMAEKMGVRIIDLGPLRLAADHIGIALARSLKLAVTNGQSYILAAALEGSRKALEWMGKTLVDADIAIYGASASAGAACAQLLAWSGANYLTLVASDSYTVNLLAKRIFFEFGVVCKVTSQPQRPLRRADLVFFAGGTDELPRHLEDFKAGALIYDLTGAANFSTKLVRDDIVLIDDSMIKLPGEVSFSRSICFTPRTIPASMAEAMILALEERFESFSIGGEIRVSRVIEIRKLAEKHGFETVGLFSRGRQLLEKDFETIRSRISGDVAEANCNCNLKQTGSSKQV